MKLPVLQSSGRKAYVISHAVPLPGEEPWFFFNVPILTTMLYGWRWLRGCTP